MAFTPTSRAQSYANQIGIEPNIILEIEGIPIKFGSQDISKFWKFDEGFLLDTPGLNFDSAIVDPDSRDYISLKGGTSNSISQQVLPDKSGTSSSLKMSINLVDYNGEVTELLKNGNNVSDILGQQAQIFIGFKGTGHPVDSIPILQGYVDGITPIQSGYTLSISHAENKKRQKMFQVYTAQLTSLINDTITTIPVTKTIGLLTPVDALEQYIQIDDEILEVTSFTSTTIDVVRSRLGTIAASHDNSSDIAGIVGLSGNAIELALKLYLSGGDEFYQTLTCTSFNKVNTDTINDTIFFSDIDLEKDFGVVDGDSFTVSGAINGANNGTFIISNITKVSTGSYITVIESGFILELTGASCDFKSQFNVLGTGMGLTPFEVDVQTHVNELNDNSASFPDYQFYLKEEINGKDFVDSELYFPSGLYSIPRKAKISCRFTRPPLTIENTPIISSDNLINVEDITAERSVHKFMYNSVVYKYEKSLVSENFLEGFISTNPLARAQTDNIDHTLQFNSSGLRRGGDTDSLISRQTNRFYNRYQYGAILYSKVKILFKDAWILEIGDVVQFGGESIKIPDLNTGTTYTPLKLCEIINKRQDISKGLIEFQLLDTNFDVDNIRFGVISPASFLTSNSTTTTLELRKSFDTGTYAFERLKWEQFVGSRIRVRSEDYSYDEITTITGLSNSNAEILIVDALSLAPSVNYLIEVPQYDESSAAIDDEYKLRFTYNSYQDVISGTPTNTVFNVADASNFLAGGTVIVRSDDYVRNEEAVIDTIVSNTITLTGALAFTPLVGDLVDNLTFKDSGAAYAFI